MLAAGKEYAEDLIVFSDKIKAGWWLKQDKKVGGKLRRFLILTGVSAVGFLASVLLHNFFYALGVLTNNIFVLHFLFEFLHGAFFIIGLFICPVGFLVGGVGSIFCFLKKR